MDWTQIHIEAVKKNCIGQVEFNQPVPQDVMDTITIPTEDYNISYGNGTLGKDTTLETTTSLPKTTSIQHSFIFTPELLTQIKEVSCINDCNEHGQCVKGIEPEKVDGVSPSVFRCTSTQMETGPIGRFHFIPFYTE